MLTVYRAWRAPNADTVHVLVASNEDSEGKAKTGFFDPDLRALWVESIIDYFEEEYVY